MAHEYFGLSLSVIWAVVQQDLPSWLSSFATGLEIPAVFPGSWPLSAPTSSPTP
ncbi:MAG: hypothetical protein ACH34U_07585 [Cyanobium sp.]